MALRRRYRRRRKKRDQPPPGPGASSENYVYKHVLATWHKGKIVERRDRSSHGYDDPSVIVEVKFPNEKDPSQIEKWRVEVSLKNGPIMMWYASPFSDTQVEEWYWNSGYPWEEGNDIEGSVEEVMFGDPDDPEHQELGIASDKYVTIFNGSGEGEMWSYEYSTVNGRESTIGKMPWWYGVKKKKGELHPEGDVGRIDYGGVYVLQ